MNMFSFGIVQFEHVSYLLFCLDLLHIHSEIKNDDGTEDEVVIEWSKNLLQTWFQRESSPAYWHLCTKVHEEVAKNGRISAKKVQAIEKEIIQDVRSGHPFPLIDNPNSNLKTTVKESDWIIMNKEYSDSEGSDEDNIDYEENNNDNNEENEANDNHGDDNDDDDDIIAFEDDEDDGDNVDNDDEEYLPNNHKKSTSKKSKKQSKQENDDEESDIDISTSKPKRKTQTKTKQKTATKTKSKSKSKSKSMSLC